VFKWPPSCSNGPRHVRVMTVVLSHVLPLLVSPLLILPLLVSPILLVVSPLSVLVISPVLLLLVSPLLLLLLVSPLLILLLVSSHLVVVLLLHFDLAPRHCLAPPPSSSPFPFPISLSPSSSSSFPLLFIIISPLIVVSSGYRFVLVGESEALVMGIGRWMAKSNHDKCRGSCFVTHYWGIPLDASPTSSSLPGSSF